MTAAAFATASGHATPFAGRGAPSPADPKEGRVSSDALRTSAADAILRAAGAIATGEA